jgi:hypothetical protein
MKLHPVSEETASGEIRVLYQHIRFKLGIDVVPLVFQYMANAQEYACFIWERMLLNLSDPKLIPLRSQLQEFVLSSINLQYRPSQNLQKFTASLLLVEKDEIRQIATTLLRINTLLFFFSIALREDLKGVSSSNRKLDVLTTEEDLLNILAGNPLPTQEEQGKEMQEAIRMLTPIFGSQGVRIVRFPVFFSLINEEMEKLNQTEAYLKTRVGLEQITILVARQLPYPLDSSYQKFFELVSDDSVAYDLLFLLKHIFPVAFPKLLLTSAVMQKALGDAKSIVSL